MGRTVWRVPATWQHPTDEDGNYIPFCDGHDEYTGHWVESDLTHYMMYMDTDDTPISPAFETPEKLARWLTDSGASLSGFRTTDYEHWLYIANGGCGLLGLVKTDDTAQGRDSIF